MIRQLFVATMAMLIVAALTLAGMASHGQSLTPAELAEAQGGNQKDAKCQDRCDRAAGVLDPDPCVDDFHECTVCLDVDAGGGPEVTMADVLGEPGEDCGAGGFRHGQGSQDCGTIVEGQCQVDAEDPDAWVCIGFDTEDICTAGVLEVEAQGP